MFRSTICAAILTLVVATIVSTQAPASPQDKDKKDKNTVVGAIWEYKFHDDKNILFEEGKFRAFDGKLFNGATQVGTYSENKDQAKLEFTRGKLKGKVDLRMVLLKPPTFKGELEQEGKKYKITVVLLKD